jgi:hypothetical protein
MIFSEAYTKERKIKPGLRDYSLRRRGSKAGIRSNRQDAKTAKGEKGIIPLFSFGFSTAFSWRSWGLGG